MSANRTALTHENLQLIRLWTEDGWGERRIARRLGIHYRSVSRARTELGLRVDQNPGAYVDEVAVHRAVKGDPAGSLTPAETRLAVAELVRYGRSNSWIATHLGVSKRTVERHRAHLTRQKDAA